MKAGHVLLLTGTAGFAIGMVRAPAFQVAVESSQVVAGLVQYPPGNSFYIYHTKVWTILHQIGALILLAGVSELTLSRAISGLLGMTAFQALGMVVYALSRNALLAMVSPVVIAVTGLAEGGRVYPVPLMGTSNTYGSLGLSLFVLVLGLFGAGWPRSAAFLLGAAPALHAGLGLWLWMVVATVLVWEGRAVLTSLRPALRFLAAGSGISVVSFVLQVSFIADVPDVDREEVARIFNAFVSLWDFHRAPLMLSSRPMFLNLAAMAAAAAGLLGLRQRLPRDATFLLESVFVCGVVGVIAVFLSWIPPHRMPSTLVTLMPSRVLVANTMVLAAMVIGLAATLASKSLLRYGPVALLLIAIAIRVDVATQRIRREHAPLNDYSNDPFFAAAADEKHGLLLTGGNLHLMQLITRRPVLLDGGGLDALPYAPESGPEMKRVLLDVYGIDLLNPPPEALRSGVVPHEANRIIWSRYSRDRWKQIGSTYNVTQVLTPADWTLDLTMRAENDEYRLYRIP